MLFYIGLEVLLEIFIFVSVRWFKMEYNLHVLSVVTLLELLVISLLVYKETNWGKLVTGFYISALSLLVFFAFSDFSSATMLGLPDPYASLQPINVHQYFDFQTFVFVAYTGMMFMWLYNIIGSADMSNTLKEKRYIFIFAFLFLYAGAFFVMSFGRFGLDTQAQFFEVWTKIYVPMYFIHLVSLIIGIAWKPSQY